MKHKKNHAYDYDDEEEYNTKREPHKRRPIRNLTKAWESHVADYEDIDDFYE